MEQIFKRISNQVIVLSVFAVVVGLTVVLWPKLTLFSVALLFGAYMLVRGLDLMIIAIGARKYIFPLNIAVQGAISIIFGLLIFFDTTRMISLISIIIGFWMVIIGVDYAKFALSMKTLEQAPWMMILILSVIDIALGVLVVCVPEVGTTSIIISAGMILIIHSLIELVSMVFIKLKAKEVESLIKEL